MHKTVETDSFLSMFELWFWILWKCLIQDWLEMRILDQDQVKIRHPSALFKLNLLSAVCKMPGSDWLKKPNLEPS